ncbi:MAG TPA: DUF3078 domain-containing protein [Prolixibacteraceae bacterium]|nr:DUF3078 domain-containing protein [Prolixibacteraceae bacterium]
MQLKNLITGFLILISISTFAENNSTDRKKEKNTQSTDSIKAGIDYLKKYLHTNNVWRSDNPEILNSVNGLIHFVEEEQIDSILIRLEDFQKKEDFRYIYRSPKQVSDSLQVPGYLSHPRIQEKMKQLDRAIWNGVDMKTIPLPEPLTFEPKNKLLPIAHGEEKTILERTGIILPDSLNNLNTVPDSLVHTPNDFQRIRNCNELRTEMLEDARLKYNIKIQQINRDAAITAYRKYAVRVYSDSLQKQLNDSLKRQNKQILVQYNDSIVRSVNDSINRYVQTLQRYAKNDSVSVLIQSMTGNPTQLWLRNNKQSISRMYIQNEQKDSLGIRIMNINKHALHIVIDDDVTFNRISHKQHRDFVFEKFNPHQKLTKIEKRYKVFSPWELGGNGTFGFTQMALSNWKKGGESAFSFLMVLKGYANYSMDSKIKWENSAELRNGWIRQGGEVNQTQKNDDKLELISRLGISAFKKWYYSTEIDFETQFFNGYKYPDKTETISAFMSPAKTLFKLGLDYKPNDNFSLFLSPITAKYVFVRDTALVDQTRYGVSPNRRSFWEPGLNADLRYKIDLTPRISYETKYKMFMNYQQPFKKVDISWENTIVAQLTNRINMTFMLFMLYDDNVTFATGRMDASGEEIYKPKWQTKEMMTIGFSYNINRHTYRQKKIY